MFLAILSRLVKIKIIKKSVFFISNLSEENIEDVNNMFNDFIGINERELFGLSKIREIKLKKFKSDQISGQRLSATFEIFKTSANSNVAAGRRISLASSAIRFTASNSRDSSNGTSSEASNTKCLHKTTERTNDHRKRS